jgi:hypothetical protein
MNKKYVLLVLLLILLVTAGVYFFTTEGDSKIAVPQPNITDYTLNPISKLNITPQQSGIYLTEGYVVRKYECPPCPPEDQCKPCMRSNIVISENDILLDTYNISDTELLVFTEDTKKFETGKKYKFLIKFLDTRSTSGPVNDVELVGFSQ